MVKGVVFTMKEEMKLLKVRQAEEQLTLLKKHYLLNSVHKYMDERNFESSVRVIGHSKHGLLECEGEGRYGITSLYAHNKELY